MVGAVSGSGSRGRVWLRSAPWIFILLAICVVQIVRAQPLDAVIFGVGAVVLGLDAAGALPAGGVRPSIPLTALIVVAAALAIILVVAPRHGVVVAVAVGAVGIAAVGIAWFLPPRAAASGGSGDSGGSGSSGGSGGEEAAERRTRIRRAAVGWACVALVMCLVELWSFLWGRTTGDAQGEHPAISELLDPALDGPIGRAVFALAWLALGVLLVTRGRRSHDA